MNHTSNILTAFLLTAGALAVSVTGCELIASVDRSKIGTGGSTTTMSSGGTTTTMSTGGTGGTGGTCATMACKAPTDCPAPTTMCVTATCEGGCCGTANASNTTACSDNSGKICDGMGKCVACNADADCPASATKCEVPTCDPTAHTCSNKPASNTTACTDNGGKVCDGAGACVKCNADADCPATGTICAVPKCDTSAHTCSNTDATKGTACEGSNNVCDGTGNCVSSHCTDGMQDADETDKDCGGSCGATCTDTGPQQKCLVAGDCISGVCSGTPLKCQPPTCADTVKNGTETDKDCGGTTCDAAGKKCADGLKCAGNADCTNSICSSGTCISCGDTAKNGNETDVDCGGADCDALGKTCATGKHCVGNADCASNFCNAGTCATKPDGTACGASAECTNAHCVPAVGGGSVCCNTGCSDQGAASCGHNAQCLANGTACANYASGTPCVGATCLDSTNSSSATAAKTCDGNGACNQGGAVMPCGEYKCNGSICKVACTPATEVADCISADYCPTTACVTKLGNGTACTAADQCTSGFCYGTPSTTCQANSCSSGVKDGTETDLDCGGPACDGAGKKCAYNKVCAVAGDCTSGVCIAGNNICGCTQMSDCPTNYDCKTATNICLLVSGQGCGAGTDCLSGTCCTGAGVPVAGCTAAGCL